MGKYVEELTRAMTMLGQNERTIFIGQAVSFPGTAMYNTLSGVSHEKREEWVVAENMQMGASVGLALQGFIPVSIFPRLNFLIEACSQLVSHLDKLEIMSNGGYKPGVIIRSGIGSVEPLDPQIQHRGDLTEALRNMLVTVEVVRLDTAEQIYPAYERALELALKGKPSFLVEWGDNYHRL